MVSILGYKGRSVISKLIKFQTRSEYSHVAIEVNGRVFESWHRGGVRELDFYSIYDTHKSNTPIDIFRFKYAINTERMLEFLEEQVGKKYDFNSVFRFVSRRSVRSDNKWFCSELVSAAIRCGGYSLQNLPDSYLSPRDVLMSPLLIKVI